MNKVISNKEETPRLFQNNFLEFFSKVSWYVPLVVYLPVVVYLIYRSSKLVTTTNLAVLFIFGIFFWSFVEYVLHRYVFHFKPKTTLGKRLIFIFHGIHHNYPRDPKRLVMPPSVSIPLAFIFYFVFYNTFPHYNGIPFFAGFVVGYLIYDITHYAIHHFVIKNKLFLKIKTHHMKHHYQNESAGFGVSSTLWDWVFGTKITN